MPAPIHGIQASFAGGEFSPALTGRVDVAKYSTGLKKARNVIVMPNGGVRNRPGTKKTAAAGDSTNQVRIIPFIASTTQAYIIELGHLYARFYTLDAQVMSLGSPYQITTPYSGSDIFNIKFAQSADVLYLAHPSYTPRTLTFVSSTNWTLANYSFLNGPFMLQNTVQANTITAIAKTWLTATSYIAGDVVNAGNVLAADLVDDFSSGSFSSWTVSQTGIGTYAVSAGILGITSNDATKFASVYRAVGGIYGSFSVQMNPGLFYFGMSTNATDTNGLPTGNGYAILSAYGGTQVLIYVISSGSVVGSVVVATGLTAGSHFITVFRDAGNLFTLYVDGVSVGTPAIDANYIAGTYFFLVAQPGFAATSQFSNIYYDSSTVTAKNTMLRATYVCLIGHISGTFATDLGNGDWRLTTLITGSGITLTSTLAQFQAGHVNALYELSSVMIAQTLSDAGFTANTHVSTSIFCGQNWSLITFGVWTGKILVQISVDNGNSWRTIQTFQNNNGANYNATGSTGVSQCLIRVAGDGVTGWGGTLTVDLTTSSFDWIGVVRITSVTNTYTAICEVVGTTDVPGGVQSTATFEWSEGSWSTYRGFPTCVTFFQDRIAWASTGAEPATGWLGKTGNYSDFGVSSPLIDSDAISFVLPSRQLNAIQSLVVMPQFLVALTSDSEWGINANNGILTPTTINIALQGHRGSSSVEPVLVGAEMILMQQMGSVVRNLLFQLSVQGFFGDNLSIISQHLFTGYSIAQMAYQQEPDSVVWFVRSDGKLISLTYLREQEVAAFTWHDTNGLFESVAVIPNSTLGINEVWFVVNRGGTRYIERMVARDQGTSPSQQFFVDCGGTYSGAAATIITGLDHLNGYSVSILADGNVVPRQVVSGGQITLSVAASVVQWGLPYVSDVETLRIEAPDNRGTLQGRRVTIPQVTLRFWNSRGGYLGPQDPGDDSTSGLDEIEQRDESDNFGTAIPLKTQDYLQSMDGSYSLDAHMFFRQVDPLPFALLAFIPQLVAGEN